MDIENYYRTRDLSLASFLYSSGQKLTDFYKKEEIVWFVFEDKESCEKLINSFWQKTAMVNAKEFADALKTMKDLLFIARRTIDSTLAEAKQAIKPIKESISIADGFLKTRRTKRGKL